MSIGSVVGEGIRDRIARHSASLSSMATLRRRSAKMRRERGRCSDPSDDWGTWNTLPSIPDPSPPFRDAALAPFTSGYASRMVPSLEDLDVTSPCALEAFRHKRLADVLLTPKV